MPDSSPNLVLTQRDFDYLRQIANRNAGLVLNDDKFSMVHSRLSRRVRALGLNSFEAYCDYVETHAALETVELVNALTTNLTAFFRERHHFEYLCAELLPALLDRHRRSKRLRLWSAGCSTGEEPYSIAMSLANAMEALPDWEVQILGTDIDSNVLKTAVRGVYDERCTRMVPVPDKARWFTPVREAGGARTMQISERLRSMVTFRQHNLLHETFMPGQFDAIFCRNVVIYFDHEHKRQTVERFARYMHDASRLFLGHSESLFRVSDRFRCLGRTVYARVG